jgi:hypothetical protein
MAKRTRFIESDAYVSEIDEGDFIDIGGKKFKVINASLHGLGEIVLSLEPSVLDDSFERPITLILPGYHMFRIYNLKNPKS